MLITYDDDKIEEIVAYNELCDNAKEHGLLDTPGWKKLKKYARRAKKLMRMVNQNKRAQRFNAVTYKFGVRLPRNVPEAYRLDEKNGN
eukprot:scaffold29925_cov122-Amphora_coffeaeformis.AAC.1